MKETKYDNKYKPSSEEINSFPDLQNGPSNLIKGSNVGIQQVGTHNFKLPLKYKKQNGEDGNVIDLFTWKKGDLH